MALLSDEHLYLDALWVKFVRTLISPELVWISYNVALSLCCVLWNVTSLSLSKISSFKRSWELLTGINTCLYDLSITWSLKYNIWRTSQTDFSLYNDYKTSIRHFTRAGERSRVLSFFSIFLSDLKAELQQLTNNTRHFVNSHIERKLSRFYPFFLRRGALTIKFQYEMPW